jgi:hypothetical protein
MRVKLPNELYQSVTDMTQAQRLEAKRLILDEWMRVFDATTPERAIVLAKKEIKVFRKWIHSNLIDRKAIRDFLNTRVPDSGFQPMYSHPAVKALYKSIRELEDMNATWRVRIQQALWFFDHLLPRTDTRLPSRDEYPDITAADLCDYQGRAWKTDCGACLGDPYSRHNHETWEDLHPARDTGFERSGW